MTTTNKQEPLGLDNLRNLIADDSYAATFQSFGQYRSALLKEFDQRAASSDDLVVEANRQLLLERGRIGIQKYGTTLASAGLSRTQLAQHALEEALDLANYLQTIIQTEARASQQAGAAGAGDAWHMSFSDDGSLLLKRGGNELRFVPAPTDTGAAGASEVKTWQERTSIPMPEPHEMLFSMRQIHAAKDAEIADLRAQLVQERHARNEWADAACSGLQWLRNIEDGTTTDTKRARENMEASVAHARQFSDALGTVPAAQAQGEPVAWITFRTKDGREALTEGCIATNRAYTEAHSKWVWEPLGKLRPAPQADEVRDSERLDFLEELAARNEESMPNVRAFGKTFMGETLRDAIDTAMRTTAADNQTKGE